MNGNGKYSQCSEDILIEDSIVYLGVGITIGSVPPNTAVNCVRNVTFRHIQLVSPIKGIHVKPVSAIFVLALLASGFGCIVSEQRIFTVELRLV